MNKPIYKLVPLFPGIIRPTYSKEEYDRVVKNEMRLLFFVLPIIGLCASGGIILLVLGFAKHLTK